MNNLNKFTNVILKKVVFYLLFILLGLSCINLNEIYAENIQIVPIIEDTYIEKNYPTVSPWNNRNLYIGFDNWYGKGITKTFIKPDFSRFINTGKVRNAQLMLYQYEDEGIGYYSIILMEPTNIWNEEILNWNNTPTLSNIIAHERLNSNIGWKSINITEWFKNVVSRNYENNGLAISQEDIFRLATVYWSTSCRVAPSNPICNEGEEPYIRVYINSVVKDVSFISESLNIGENKYLIRWNAFTDPDGDLMNVKLQQSSDPIFYNIINEYDVSNISEYESSLISQNNYFRLVINDGYDITYSNVINIYYDDIPPTIPDLSHIPPFINKNEITIGWDEVYDDSSNIINYEFCYSNKTDMDYICSIVDTNLFKVDLINSELRYYFKIRSIDKFNNISNWSNIVSTMVDYTPPILGKIFNENKYISSSESDKLQKTSIEAIDFNDKVWSLYVLNSLGEIIDKYEGVNESEITYSINYTDGVYSNYFEVIDALNNKSRSEFGYFTVDTKPPEIIFLKGLPEIKNVNIDKLYIEYKVKDALSYELMLNDKLISRENISEFGSSVIHLKQGTNNILYKFYDIAGNVSEVKKEIYVDSIPPKIPEFLSYNFTNTDLNFRVSCEIGAEMYFFINGINVLNSKCEKNGTEINITYEFLNGSKYILNAYSKDSFNNISEFSDDKVIYINNESEYGIGYGGAEVGKDTKYLGNGECRLNIYLNRNTYELVSCNIPAPIIREMDRYLDNINNNYSELEILGNQFKGITFDIRYYDCKKYSIWDTSTWFGKCSEYEYYYEKQTIERPFRSVRVFDNGNLHEGMIYWGENDGGFKYIHQLKNDNYPQEVQFASIILIDLVPTKYTQIYTYIYSNKSEIYKTPIEIKNRNSGFMDFIFKKNIGVTQWYGYTAYQSPHKGIDFGAYYEDIYAPESGTVVYKNWDSYGGTCYQGGNGLIIKHNNGMYSAYFHLDNFKKQDGSELSLNETVIKGQKIGTTGATGYYNCIPLKAHLHFELRKGRESKYHTDPVAYINIDWSKIPTLGHKENPGRLTGNNPHPGY